MKTGERVLKAMREQSIEFLASDRRVAELIERESGCNELAAALEVFVEIHANGNFVQINKSVQKQAKAALKKHRGE